MGERKWEERAKALAQALHDVLYTTNANRPDVEDEARELLVGMTVELSRPATPPPTLSEEVEGPMPMSNLIDGYRKAGFAEGRRQGLEEAAKVCDDMEAKSTAWEEACAQSGDGRREAIANAAALTASESAARIRALLEKT